MQPSPSWETASCAATQDKSFGTFYGTRSFITVFTGALHWFVSWARATRSLPLHYISLRSILILSIHVYAFVFLAISFLSPFAPTFYAFLSSPDHLCGIVVSSWLLNGDELCFLWGTNWIYICYIEESRRPLWASGQSSWLQMQGSRVRFPGTKKSSGSGTGCTQPREYNWGVTW
jgi:hypothetical protein